MLSQKMSKEIGLALLKRHDQRHMAEAHSPALQLGERRSKSCGLECHSTASQFERGLQALMKGGRVTYANKIAIVPPPSDPSFRAALKEVQSAWKRFIKTALTTMESGPENPAFTRRLAEMEHLSLFILEKMDEAVRIRQAEADGKVRLLIVLQLFFLLIGGLTLAIGYWLVLRHILQPVRALTKAVQLMGQSDLDIPINVRVDNELGLLANAFDAMWTRLKTHIKQLEVLIRIIHAANQRLNIRDIARAAIEGLERFFPDTALAVFSYDAKADEFVLEGYNAAAEPIAMLKGMTVGDRVDAKRFRFLDELKRGICIKLDDLAQLSIPTAESLVKVGFRSAILCPLASGGELMGVIHAGWKEPKALNDEGCLLEDLRDHFAIAFHNANLLTNLQRAYEELKETQAMLVQQERLWVLGQMASGIVHDVNNALVPIVASLEILSDHPDAEVKEWARRGKMAVDDLTQTINRLRVFYQKQTSQMEMESVDLNEMVEQVVNLTRPRWFDQAQREGVTIDLVTDLDETMPAVAGIGAEIREALVNLVFNAVDAIVQKAESKGQKEEDERQKSGEHGTIVVRTGWRDGWAVLEVQDSGIGMDEKTKLRCLEPFFTTKNERGSGLGLAMVYGIMQRHDGKIEIESELGEGSTFRLLFPLRTAEQKERAEEWEGSVPPLRVLLVDDDPRSREAVAEMLVHLGHKVTGAGGSEEGLAKFEAALERGEPFDLVVTDLGMPKVTSEEFIQSVKALSSMTPVIVMTGWGKESQPAIADAGLSKPVHLRDLSEVIAQLWQRSV